MALDLSSLDAFAIRDGIATKQFTAGEVLEAALGRVDAVEERVRAFIQLTDMASNAAVCRIDRMVAAGEELPPLAGVPAGIKDNMNMVRSRTTCAARILENHCSVYDATAVERLLDAGVVPVGKTNLDEWAFGSSTENSAFGPSRNPWDLERVPGGSSGGSAAAVSAGEAVVALGSDTGGSIRQPGSFTGTVAMKPTYGRVSRYGLVAFASSLDQIGPFAKSVKEAAAVLEAISGHDPMDATSVERPVERYVDAAGAGAEGLRVGVVTGMLAMDGLQPEVRYAVEGAAERLAGMGAEVGEAALPHSEYALAAYYIIGPAEASSNLARFDGIRYGVRVTDAEDVIDLYMRSRAEGFGPEAHRRVMLGTYALSAGYYDAYYGQAQKARRLIADDFAKAFSEFDVLLTPTSPTTAFRIGEKVDDPVQMYLSDVYTIPVNLAGNAAISIPAGLADGLPIGLQIVGDHFQEAAILRAAGALEADIGFDPTPPLVREIDESGASGGPAGRRRAGARPPGAGEDDPCG
jgi:aspartyl-tRNA(Asn)/glutamyl-tRNA(Gln) amidotransferase subunit A